MYLFSTGIWKSEFPAGKQRSVQKKPSDFITCIKGFDATIKRSVPRALRKNSTKTDGPTCWNHIEKAFSVQVPEQLECLAPIPESQVRSLPIPSFFQPLGTTFSHMHVLSFMRDLQKTESLSTLIKTCVLHGAWFGHHPLPHTRPLRKKRIGTSHIGFWFSSISTCPNTVISKFIQFGCGILDGLNVLN
jgi:hypothetical protein